MATLPGAWRYKVSAGTGWLIVSILWLGEMESLICNFYVSVAACKMSEKIRSWETLACCWDVKQPTNNYYIFIGPLAHQNVQYAHMQTSITFELFEIVSLLTAGETSSRRITDGECGVSSARGPQFTVFKQNTKTVFSNIDYCGCSLVA